MSNSKRELEKTINEIMNMDNIIYDVNDEFISKEHINLSVEMKTIKPYQTIFIVDLEGLNIKDYSRTLEYLNDIINKFDFSYTLEFYTLDEIFEFRRLL